jgi:lipoate-protein ligase A
MHHGTILFDSNMSVLAGALQVDPAKIQAKGVKSVRSRVTNVRPYLPEDLTLAQFRAFLLESILEEFPGEQYELTAEDMEAIAASKNARYDTWEWNFGYSPACTVSKKQRFEGCGSVEAFMDINKGCIRSITFRGDFFAAEDPAALTEVLIGCPLEEAALAEQLQNYDISRYFMGLNLENLVQLLTG